ncbi:TetR/AcrR family transcriptional regulator [Pyruvatibacter sp. HU-CL02332]|uniref:TetR/AcrR family transcriptional regulator n=1 Tax=Pyruvatibacter sp. HU-CL02332 TaxID=3127650 RepID=UPI00336531AC
MIMPKKVDHDQRRSQLAEAAVVAIDTHGLDSVRLIDVAREAKLTTGAVVHYLNNKDDVLLAAFDQVGLRNAERLEQTRGMDPVDRAMTYLPHNDETAREWRVFLQFWGRGVSDPAFRERHRAGYEALAHSLRLELEAGGATDPQTVADAMIAGVDGIAVRVAMEPDAWDMTRMRKTISALILPLMAAHTPDTPDNPDNAN